MTDNQIPNRAEEIFFEIHRDNPREGPDEIEATKVFYDVMTGLISSGNKADCIQIWFGTKKDQIKRRAVDLSSISKEAFRFFENHHFVFSQVLI